MLKRTLIALGIGILLAVVGSALWLRHWTESRLSVPTVTAMAALESGAAVSVTNEDWLVFAPRGRRPRLGLVFYPGAHCDVRGYAPALRAIAEQGYLVIAVPMPLYLAILAPDRAREVIAAYADVDRWVLAGHSLGGTMAARYAQRHPETTHGLVIWDSYPAGSMAEYAKPVWLIHRSGADGKPPDMYADGLTRFPDHTRYVPIRGGNHLNFGDFIVGPAQQDIDPTITRLDQQTQVAEATLDALDSVLKISNANRAIGP